MGVSHHLERVMVISSFGILTDLIKKCRKKKGSGTESKDTQIAREAVSSLIRGSH